MTRPTRLFLFISAGVLLVGVGTGVIASYMGLQGLTRIGSDGPEELAYVPRDAGMVAFANVRKVMDSDLRRRILERRPAGSGIDRNDFQATTGISIETDIDIVVTSLESGVSEGRSLVLARGRFDAVRIERLMRRRGGQAEDYKGRRLITAIQNDHTFTVAFVEPGLTAFGSGPAVRRAIDTKSSAGASITSNAEVMALVRDIDDGDAWAAGRFDAVSRRARLPQEFANQLPPITWFSATGRINGGVQGLVRAEASTEQAARDLRDVIRGFMALAQLQTKRNSDLALLMSSLDLGGEGRTVSLGFSVPPEMIDTLAALQRPAPPPPPAATPQLQAF